MHTNQTSAIINFYKPSGISSAEFLNIIKQQVNCKKAGFAGTLDPMASGVLLVGIDQGTKLLHNLSNLNKQYFVKILFGVQTNTGDITGKVIKESLNFDLNLKNIDQCLNEFKNNKYMQTPPKFSAISVNGIRAYKLARNDIDFSLTPRRVFLFDYKIVDFKMPILSLLIDVSKGFYVRQLAEDLAQKLQTLATCKKIVRTKCGDYNLKDSKILTDLTPFYYD